MFIEEVIEEYVFHCLAKGFTEKTMINKNQELKQFRKYLKKNEITKLDQLTTPILRKYIREKQKSGLQPQSIVTMSKVINAFLNWCVREEYLKENPMKKVELPKVPKKVLKGFTSKEVAKMIKAFTFNNYIEARNKAIIAMLADCGLRAIEIRRLKASNVRHTTILVNGKGNKERMVFVSPTLKKILIRYERLRKQYFYDKVIKDDVYFLSYTGERLSHPGIYNVIKEAGKRAGIQDKRVSPHTFRHFYAVQSLNSGKLDLYSLSRLLGHSDVSTTQRYLNSLSDAQLLDKAISASPLMNLNKKGD